MIQKSLDNLSHKNSPLHFGFGEQDTTSSERYCTGGENNSIGALTGLVHAPNRCKPYWLDINSLKSSAQLVRFRDRNGQNRLKTKRVPSTLRVDVTYAVIEHERRHVVAFKESQHVADELLRQPLSPPAGFDPNIVDSSTSRRLQIISISDRAHCHTNQSPSAIFCDNDPSHRILQMQTILLSQVSDCLTTHGQQVGIGCLHVLLKGEPHACELPRILKSCRSYLSSRNPLVLWVGHGLQQTHLAPNYGLLSLKPGINQVVERSHRPSISGLRVLLTDEPRIDRDSGNLKTSGKRQNPV